MMRVRRTALLAIMALTALLAAGCVTLTSPDSQLYTLSSSTEMGSSMTASPTASLPVLAVGPVDLPDYLRRPQIVSRQGRNRVKVAEFDRWAAPLNEQVERVLTENLGARLPQLVVVSYREQRFKPKYRLTMNVERFERQDMDQVELVGRWTLADAAGGEVLVSEREHVSVPVEGQGYEATVAAQSVALARLADAMSLKLKDLSGPRAQRK